MDPKDVVLAFWRAMASNDFVAASEYLSANFKGYWPQSKELICGRDNFAAINSSYPAQGRWRFNVVSIMAEGDQVVTEVAITDGAIDARAITFHTVADGLITRQREFWPDVYPAPDWRANWVTITDETPENV